MDFLTLRRKLIEKDFGFMNDRQFEAVTTVKGPLLVLAGAGSGKTTVLVNRIAYLCKYGDAYNCADEPFLSENDISLAADYLSGESDRLSTTAFAVNPPRAYEILAITFTNKAAGELKTRIADKLGADADVWAGTFHSICGRILRMYGDRLGFSSHFTIYDADDQKRLMKDIMKSRNVDEKIFPVKSVLSAISNAKDSLIGPDEFAKSAGNDLRLKTVSVLYSDYQKQLLNSDAMDFDDMIFYTVRLFKEFDDVLKIYKNRFKYIMVDEYQDTNLSQYELVATLAGKDGNICVVGDDDQSIYRFRGATIENILNFEDDFKDAKVIRLEQNYRSTSYILDAANGVIANNAGRKGKSLWTDKKGGEKLAVYVANDDRDEARFVADTILDLVKGGAKFSDNTLLYRMNAQSRSFENTFMRSGISYRIIGGTRFYDRAEIKDLLSFLAVINNTNDSLRLRRIINVPRRGIGETTINHAAEIADTLGVSLFEVLENAENYAPLSKAAEKLIAFCRMIRQLQDFTNENSLSDTLNELLNVSGYSLMLDSVTDPDAPDRKANVEQLLNEICDYQASAEQPSLADYLEQVALFTDIDKMNDDDDKVTLMTVHAAKGLEFKNVFIVGFEEELFPSALSIYGTAADIEEERRLAYVAITRAKEMLYITRAKSRLFFGQTKRNLPSRFLEEIPTSLYCETCAAPAFFFDGADDFAPRHSSVHVFGGGKPQKKVGSTLGSFTAKRPESAGSGKYFIGQEVNHKTFGKGVVLSVSSMGADTLLEIKFDTVGTKKLMASFAKLEV